MNSKKSVEKRVVLGILLIGIIIASISFVSAKWWIFGEEGEGEGELAQSAAAKVTVTNPATPPRIWYVSGLNGTGGGAGPLIASSPSFFKFDFYACSIGGEGQMPDATETSRIFGAINGSYGGSPRIDQAITCRYNNEGVFTGQPGAGTCTGNSRNYSCDVRVYYYYDYQTTAGVTINWGINASIQDDASRISSNISKTFVVAQLKSWDQTPLNINWTSIQAGATNSLASNQVKIINTGNGDITNVVNPISSNFSITGTNLMRGAGVENITADEFNVAVYTGTPCTTGNTLGNLVEVAVNPFAVLHTASTPSTPANNNLSFCIPGPLSVTAGDYETGSLPAQKWTFTAFGV
ncbi:MAG: hypothetical protein Q8N63_05670 [Nanoarchaeota archaeon]|nr:hypothetical protein [Nanoarchaeota archaeon]